MSYQFELAKEEDEAELRSILSSIALTGNISVTFEREPHYFHGSAIEGDIHDVIVTKKEGQIIAMVNRSISSAYLNGKQERIGYLSQLRVLPSYRDIRILSGGHRYIQQLDQAKEVPSIYMASIVADNETAIKVLTSGKFGLPTYSYFGTLHTYAIQLKGKKKKRIPTDGDKNIHIVQGESVDKKAIVSFLQREGSLKQFYPYYTVEDLESNERSKDLNWNDFYIAKQGDRIVGVVAVWDQHGFKQTVVKGYSTTYRRLKWLYNLGSKLFHYAPLPQINEAFRYFYLSHVCVENNDPEIFSLLLQHVYNQNVQTKYAYFMVGLFEQDPLIQTIQGYSSILYKSHLYTVHWKDNLPTIRLDGRVPYMEISRL